MDEVVEIKYVRFKDVPVGATFAAPDPDKRGAFLIWLKLETRDLSGVGPDGRPYHNEGINAVQDGTGYITDFRPDSLVVKLEA